MAEYEITAPDGNRYRVTAPDDATEDQVLAYAQANYQGAAAPSPQDSAPTAPDFSGVTATTDSTAHMVDPSNPTEGMSAYDRFMAGMGRSVVETGRGLKQVGTDAAANSARNAALLANAAGLDGVAGSIVSNVGIPLANQQRQNQADIDEARKLDAPLMATGWGQAGNATGTVAQFLTPGVALKSTALARVALPTTIRGNALLGAAEGASQPTATGESRGLNALTGGAFGGGTAGLFKLAGMGYNALAGLARTRLSSAERGAGEALLREAADPAALQRVAPSQVPGVQRTLAEETLDPGIARLERTVRSTGGPFDAIDRANNSARVRSLETFAQDDAALSAARRDRNQQTNALRDQAMQDRGVDVAAVRSALGKQLEATATRPSVQSALQDVKRSLDEAGDDVFSLYGTRKYIDDLLSGKAGGDKSYAKAATRELIQVKGLLDEKLADASPSFSQYLQKYRDLSVPINRMEVGQALTSRSSGSAILDPVTGAQVLTPAQFSKASRSLDDVAKKATGFAKAKATDILRPGDIAIIKAIQDDLERQAFRATAGSGGNSQTFERLGVQERLARGAGREILGRAPVVGQYVRGFLDVLDKTRNDQLKERLAYLIANPEEARRVIAALPPNGQEIVTRALTQIGGAAGAFTGAATVNQDQPLEIEIVGGTPVPAAQFDRYARP